MSSNANVITGAGESAAGEVARGVSATAAPAADQMGDLPVIALEGVSKRFNEIYALRDISVTVRSGEVFCLLGPTGAGKSTLVRLLLGFLQPDEGAVLLFGTTDPQLARSRVGYMPENARYHAGFSGRDYLYFHARLSGMTRSGARKAVERARQFGRAGVDPRLDRSDQHLRD